MAKGACSWMFELTTIGRLEEIRQAFFTVITTLGRGYLILKEKGEVLIRAFTFCIWSRLSIPVKHYIFLFFFWIILPFSAFFYYLQLYSWSWIIWLVLAVHELYLFGCELCQLHYFLFVEAYFGTILLNFLPIIITLVLQLFVEQLVGSIIFLQLFLYFLTLSHIWIQLIVLILQRFNP